MEKIFAKNVNIGGDYMQYQIPNLTIDNMKPSNVNSTLCVISESEYFKMVDTNVILILVITFSLYIIMYIFNILIPKDKGILSIKKFSLSFLMVIINIYIILYYQNFFIVLTLLPTIFIFLKEVTINIMEMSKNETYRKNNRSKKKIK